MPGTNANPDAAAFLKTIEDAENQANELAAFIKKLKARLARTKKVLLTKPVAAQVSALISDLDAFKSAPSAPSVERLRHSLEVELKELQRRFQDSFPDDLRNACESAGLSFTALPDGFGVGAFYVTLNREKGTAAFQFAKIDMDATVPLNASAIVERAVTLKTSLLDEPVDLAKFAADVNEAMRVALARQGTVPTTEWRVELPLVFRELTYIRMNQPKRRKSTQPGYSPCRFVVELKEFIQSTDNMQSDEQYRLETAVLENTKNPKKSIFIPRDISRSFGEGTYYQAILLRHI